MDSTGAAGASGNASLRQRGPGRPPQDAPLSKAAQAKLQMHENLQVVLLKFPTLPLFICCLAVLHPPQQPCHFLLTTIW